MVDAIIISPTIEWNWHNTKLMLNGEFDGCQYYETSCIESDEVFLGASLFARTVWLAKLLFHFIAGEENVSCGWELQSSCGLLSAALFDVCH